MSAPTTEPTGTVPGSGPDPAPKATTSPTRTSAALSFAVLGGLLLTILLVFVLQNLDRSTIEFLGWSGRVPVGIALLLAAVAGGAIVAVAAFARILQLRRRATGWKR